MTAVAKKSRVALIQIENQPVNTLSREVREKLICDIKAAQRNPDVAAVILTGSLEYFSAGADINELSKPWALGQEEAVVNEYVEAYETHNLASLVYLIDQSPKPVIALISGIAYGGGLELALGCHYRFCTPTSSFSFPEVKIGIIPGALGTQYIPRLCAFDKALQLCCSGEVFNAETALQHNIVDQILNLDDDKAEKSIQNLILRVENVLQRHLTRGEKAPSPFRRTSLIPVKTHYKEAIIHANSFLSKQTFKPFGSKAIIGCVQSLLSCITAGSDFIKGALEESRISRFIILESCVISIVFLFLIRQSLLIRALIVSSEAQALRYLFFAERHLSSISSSCNI
jgi:enoyl-CoA hydratase/carnithine racemase